MGRSETDFLLCMYASLRPENDLERSHPYQLLLQDVTRHL